MSGNVHKECAQDGFQIERWLIVKILIFYRDRRVFDALGDLVKWHECPALTVIDIVKQYCPCSIVYFCGLADLLTADLLYGGNGLREIEHCEADYYQKRDENDPRYLENLNLLFLLPLRRLF